MRKVSYATRHCWTGFSMLGLLLALVILFLVIGYYFRGTVEQQEEAVGTYQYSMDRAKSVARGEDLRVLQQSIDMWAVSHPGERCTIEKLRADGRYTIPQPPSGSRFEIDEANKATLVEDRDEVRGVPVSPSLE